MEISSIEEINKLRKSMGMKLLPVPGAASLDSSMDAANRDAPSTLETREAAAGENALKLRQIEAAKRKREEKTAAIKKARDKEQRFAVLEGSGLGDLDAQAEVDTKSWLKNQKKRQKKIERERNAQREQLDAKAAAAAQEQYTGDNINNLKVGHDANTFFNGDEQILTLKDAGVLDDDEDEDVLENQDLREREDLEERLQLKKKRPIYDPLSIDDGAERGLLSQYDEEISGKRKRVFTLNAQAAADELADILEGPVQKRGNRAVQLGTFEDAPVPASDYLDVSEVKIRKSKKKKPKVTRHPSADDGNDVLKTEELIAQTDQSMEVDSGFEAVVKKRKIVDDAFVDDDYLQSSLARQRKEALKKRKKLRPEDIAQQLRDEPAEDEDGKNGEQAKGIVLDEITGFVDTLQKFEETEVPKIHTKAQLQQSIESRTAASSDEDEEMKDAATAEDEPSRSNHLGTTELTTTGVEEEEAVGQGMGAAVKLLRERGLIKESGGEGLNDQFRRKQLFLAELHRRMAHFDEETRQQRERDRGSGRLDRMSARDREEWQRQQNSLRDQHQSRIMDQLYKEGYKPSVELKYFDELGRALDQKEAFKHLSHQFHGKGSGKGKTDKRLKKIEDAKRRDAQSVLDASQNIGMSSAAAQQIKKRREAGVRLA